MKSYIAAAVLLFGLGCKSTTVDKKDGIRYKETVTLNDVPKATLTFDDVQDSRCPEGVNCVWAGNATVDLLLAGVTAEGGINEHVKMCVGDCRTLYKVGPYKMSDTLTKTFAGTAYQFILLAVNPPAKVDSTRTKADYSIQLKVEKL